MPTITPDQAVAAIRDWGVEFVPWHDDWGSQVTAGGWDPAGIAHHHTAGSGVLAYASVGVLGASQRSMLELLRVGRGGSNPLDGPLCHFAPTFVGKGIRRVYGIGWRNTNHAGYIKASVAAQLRAGTYKGGGTGPETVDGNSMLYGFEYLHPGDGTEWPTELLEAGHLTACALAEAHGWDRDHWAGSNAEHRELTTRKVDRSWSGWGDGMRAAITKLSQAAQEPAPASWARSDEVRQAISALRKAADQKEGKGRKRQAAWLREYAADVAKRFPQ